MPAADCPRWPDWLPELPRLDDPDHSRQVRIPMGVVVHSGEHAARVAESVLEDGRGVSYHIAWHSARGEYVQLVSLRDRAYHAGPRGNHWVGVALPGPYDLDPRPDEQRVAFRAMMELLLSAFAGGLWWWCRHSDIDVNKKDPGPGFRDDWLAGMGLRWRRAG